MDKIKVRKRDGSEEDWNVDKLITSISKAGVPVENAQEISSQIKSWIESESGGVVSSDAIRDKAIELMSDDFPTEAEGYKAYKK